MLFQIAQPIQRTILASAARTATPTATAQDNPFCKGLDVIVDVTALTATGTLTVTIDAQDPASAKWYNLLTGAAIVGTGTTVYRIAPGLTAAANLIANDVLPRTWRVVVTHGNGVSITYSVGAVLLP